MKIAKRLLLWSSVLFFAAHRLYAFEPDADLVLLLPSMTEADTTELQAEAQDWIEYRQATRGHTVQVITLKDVADYAGVTQAANLVPEDIRIYLRDHFTHSRYSSYPNGRYLGLLSYAPNGTVFDEYAATSGNHDKIINSSNFTLEFFFRLDDLSKSQSLFFYYDVNKINGLRVDFEQGGLQIQNDVMIAIMAPDVIHDTNWHHFALVSQSGTDYVYVDGVAVGSGYVSATIPTGKPMLLGASLQYYNESVVENLLHGAIDECRISSVARYTGNFAVPSQPFVTDSSTRALYHFDETSGAVYSDASGNGYALTGYGTPDVGSSLSPALNNSLVLDGFYGDEDAAYAYIPRYDVYVGGQDVEWVPTDILYGYLDPEKVVNEDGSLATDLTNPSFLVFRMPVRQAGQLNFFFDKSTNYEAAAYNRDLTLVAGRFAKYGDTEMVQCLNASKVKKVNKLFKVFDDNVCSPTLVTTGEEQRLFQFMTNSIVSGGLYYNISHGSADGMNAVEVENLRISDVTNLPMNKLDIVVSLACDNDGSGSEGDSVNKNLANVLMEHESAAVLSSTETLYPENLADIRIGELQFLQQFYDNPNTLLQAAQSVREQYMRYYSRTPSDTHYLINLLAMNVLGDGLIRLPQSAPVALSLNRESQASLTSVRPNPSR